MVNDSEFFASLLPPQQGERQLRAVVLYEHGERDVLTFEENYPDPSPGPGKILLRVRATSLNYHDIFTRRGMPGIRIGLPRITGSDVAGEVFEIGKGVQDWSTGDRVLVDPMCPNEHGFGMIGETSDGGRAELMLVSPEQLIRLPNGVSFVAAASLPLAYGTAYRMMFTRGRVQQGDRVLVLGASGGVGTGCVVFAKQVGAEVIACASSPDKLARLGGLGADHLVNYREQNFVDAVRDLYGKPRITGGGGVNMVVNFTGGDTWVRSLKCLCKGGRMVTCGATAGYDPPTDLRYIWTFEHNIIGANGWAREDLEVLVHQVNTGRFEPVINAVLPLTEAAEAERLLEEREVFGKVLLTP